MKLPSVLVRALFRIYLSWNRYNPIDGQVSPVFLWKHAYFLMWHIFFWSLGRTILERFMPITPLLPHNEASPRTQAESATHLMRRDRDERPFSEKIVHTTRFPLAPDTVDQLTLIAYHHATIAPWQYGKEARRKATRTMGLIGLCSLALACVFFNSDAPPDSVIGWMRLVSLLGMLVGVAGWVADTAIERFVLEGVRRHSPKNSP